MINEQQITQYLLDNPSYVQNNLALFLEDNLQAVSDNQNLSLSAYQTKQFYKKYKDTHTQLNELVEVADTNYQAQQKVYDFVAKILQQKDKVGVANLLNNRAKNIFNIAEAKLIIWQQSGLKKSEMQRLKRYLDSSSVYFGTMDTVDKIHLFKKTIKTIALVPLKRVNNGMLVFGANDDYFADNKADASLLKLMADVIYWHLKNVNETNC